MEGQFSDHLSKRKAKNDRIKKRHHPKNPSLARRLLKMNGVNVNERDSDGATPLMHASSGNFLPVVELLVKKGRADVNLGDNKGFTPLFLSAQMNNPVVVTWLIDKGGADVNQANNDGTTPLIMSGQLGHRGVAKLLEPFDVRPKQVWVDGKNRRGYEKGWFEDAWKRYLAPQTPETLATSDRSDRIVGGQQVTPDSQVIGDEVPIGCENPVSGCGTTILSDLTVRDPQNPQNRHVPR